MNEKLLKIKNLLSSLIEDEEVKEEQKYGSVTTENGILYWDGEEELKVNDAVYVLADPETGDKAKAEDGEYKLEDGTVIKVADGKVAEIVKPAEEEEETPAPEKEEEEEEKPAPETLKEEEEPKEPEEEEEVRDLAKELDELKDLVAELQKKLESVENETPKAPAEEFEAITDEKELSMAERYAAALRK